MILLSLLIGSWELAEPRLIDAEAQRRDPAWQARYAELVGELARYAPRGALPRGAAEAAAALDLELTRDGDRVWLMEPAAAPAGLGLVGLNLGPMDSEWVVQAPHPRADLRTGALAAALFDAGQARALVLATSHRRTGSDAAHDPEGLMQDATAALSRALPRPLVVQLHGFGEGSAAGDAVVSPGPTPMSEAALSCALQRLEPALGPNLLTGVEAPELAGRTNAQGRLLRGQGRFLHLELSRPLRDALYDNPTQLALLGEALSALALGVPCDEGAR